MGGFFVINSFVFGVSVPLRRSWYVVGAIYLARLTVVKVFRCLFIVSSSPSAVVFFGVFRSNLREFVFGASRAFFPTMEDRVICFNGYWLPIFCVYFVVELRNCYLFKGIL